MVVMGGAVGSVSQGVLALLLALEGSDCVALLALAFYAVRRGRSLAIDVAEPIRVLVRTMAIDESIH